MRSQPAVTGCKLAVIISAILNLLLLLDVACPETNPYRCASSAKSIGDVPGASMMKQALSKNRDVNQFRGSSRAHNLKAEIHYEATYIHTEIHYEVPRQGWRQGWQVSSGFVRLCQAASGCNRLCQAVTEAVTAVTGCNRL